MSFGVKSLIFYYFFIGCLCNAQQTIEGYVYNQVGIALRNVKIYNLIDQSEYFTNDNGFYKIPFHHEYQLLFEYVDQENFEVKGVSKNAIVQRDVILQSMTLQLDEVQVIGAKSKVPTSSAIVYDKYAINQVQNFSLSDILDQLPGGRITSPSLNTRNILNLRTTINDSKNNAFGVSIIVDDLQLSNDENMQSYDNDNTFSKLATVNTGIDLRTIPSSNIESIEVITGIPDAKYNNVTTGIIKVNTKAGISPYNIRANVNSGTTNVSISKGYELGKRIGKLSFSLDYLNSLQDPRDVKNEFNRINLNTIWTKKIKNINNTFSLNLSSNLDDFKIDKEFENKKLQDGKLQKNRGITFSNRMSYRPEKHAFYDYINIQLGGSYKNVRSFTQTFVNSGGKILPTSLIEGVFPGEYTPVAYQQKKETFGEPLNINSNISLGKTVYFNKQTHSLGIGANFSYGDNFGKGKIIKNGSASSQSTVSGNISSKSALRPLDFGKYVKPIINFGLYLKDELKLKFSNKNTFFANVGVRIDYQNNTSTISPRVNVAYQFNKKWNIRSGFGLLTKSPSFNQIYPGNHYQDVLIKDYRGKNFAYNLVQTYVDEIKKIELKPSKNLKFELGLDYKINILNLNLTAFYNKTKDGFGSRAIYLKEKLPNIKFIVDEDEPSIKPEYNVIGYQPFVRNYNLPTNNVFIENLGADLILDFKKIKTINTDFSIVANFTKSKSKSNDIVYKLSNNKLATEYLYGLFESNFSEKDAFSAKLFINHHVPKLALLISGTVESFIYQKNYAPRSNYLPYAYMNNELQVKPIPFKERSDDKYKDISFSPRTILDAMVPNYFNYHLRVTKEMINGLTMSVYVTNFLNHRPVVKINDSYSEQNQPISFGGSISYKL